jgi:hypothetical protein
LPARIARLAALCLLVLAASGFTTCPEASLPDPDLDTVSGAFVPLDRPVSFEGDVKPVLENRCVVCHACYDAPCQLQLSSREGAERGAIQEPVYDSTRLEAAQPTRLFVDAQSTEAWRERGFFPVLGSGSGNEVSVLGSGSGSETPVLLSMLALGRLHPPAPGERLPDRVELDIDRKLSCPTAASFPDYARQQPEGGMPYGTAPLEDRELQLLATWVAQRAPAPPPALLPEAAEAQRASWEALLNGASTKEQLVARYLYEHWFLAHLALEGFPSGPFLEVVRSRTPPGQPIDGIATVRPFDDPGVPRVFYRLRPIRASIVHKTHVVYRLGDAKLRRLRELFFETDWQPTRLPGYSRDEASNPFVAFAEIPARSRYAFLLDDAHYFVMTFIRGPVCRGQVAVDVVEDHFWVAFLDPERDPAASNPEFLARTKHLLDLPAEYAGSVVVPGKLWLEFNLLQRRYMDAREAFYDELDPERRGPALDWIWDGDGRNPNALLTVFRNFDSATVVKGFVGEIPKTAWVMDYPIFERIYYNLVAGFDIYGHVAHQVATRLYMDHLRMQSENLFLGFLPADRRQEIRASWYVGATRQLDYARVNRLRALDHGTQIAFSTPDPKAELLLRIRRQAGAAAGPDDPLNRCGAPPCERAEASPLERGVERELQRVAAVRGDFVRWLPEVSLLRVRVDASGQRDLVYALVHNAAHANVAFMFGEDERRLPAEDTLTLIPGHIGSYPNFFFEVAAGDVASFVDALRAVRGEADLDAFVARYGVRRSDPRFWQISDWLRADLRRRDPVEAGIYDLGRYQNL